ncbi:magnesium chelatase subunit D [Qipengyuania qiaonensis]|uniref:Magnesium chelatase subunit D n=1 Tax=Qipengyuania qiaonensis TaxID=2867240 RepID=A0ABS7JC21_9SPHN|nr:magnesium chelatase subunit D [Qipengyuania qiaonensis]MBX7483510.1 magnesium chelatase subunit D [Qipengyuania qiaonensis]
MTEHAAPARPLDDALLALRLFLMAPARLGGICLRGGGPARELVLERLQNAAVNVRRMPIHIDDERLIGGVDIAASLAVGRTIYQRGLLEDIAGAVLLVPLAERMPGGVAGRLAQSIDCGAPEDRFGLVLLDDGIEADDTPPACLLERVAFICNLSQVDSLALADDLEKQSFVRDYVAPLEDTALMSIAATAAALGIVSARPMLFAAETARLHATLHGRKQANAADLEAAVRLVLAPRARRLPPIDDELEASDPEEQSSSPPDDNGSAQGRQQLEDVVLQAALAAIPPDLLVKLSLGKAGRSAKGSGYGRRRRSMSRGKPLGARPGFPGGGARLALIDSLRAAVPWQDLRRRESGSDRPLILHKGDLRIRRFEQHATKVTIFCVDASGSAAAARLAEAKGAVELMLAQAYATRSEVALIAFRGTSAELLLPPTRSLTRARRALAELPGGGGTPLAAGLKAARELAEAVEMRGSTPHLVILTDGRGNMACDGSSSRSRAAADVEATAKAIAARDIETLVVDISARAGQDGPRLAQSMQACFLALPMADARKLHHAVVATALPRVA